MEMTSRQMLEAVDRSLAEASRRLEAGELEGSGRYHTDEELVAATNSGGRRAAPKTPKSSAA